MNKHDEKWMEQAEGFAADFSICSNGTEGAYLTAKLATAFRKAYNDGLKKGQAEQRERKQLPAEVGLFE